MLALIAACARGGVIGVNNTLPWHLPADLKHFKTITMGAPVIMGRKTYDSIGRALPGRRNIVISRNSAQVCAGSEVVTSLEQALQLTADEEKVFVIGGGEIYRQTITQAQRLYITEVDITVDGDTMFPEILPTQWRETARQAHAATATTPAFAFVEYARQ